MRGAPPGSSGRSVTRPRDCGLRSAAATMNVPGDSPLEAYGPKAISWRSGASSGPAAELRSVATTWKSGAGDGSLRYGSSRATAV